MKAARQEKDSKIAHQLDHRHPKALINNDTS
jgi:hypothetical protein